MHPGQQGFREECAFGFVYDVRLVFLWEWYQIAGQWMIHFIVATQPMVTSVLQRCIQVGAVIFIV